MFYGHSSNIVILRSKGNLEIGFFTEAIVVVVWRFLWPRLSTPRRVSVYRPCVPGASIKAHYVNLFPTEETYSSYDRRNHIYCCPDQSYVVVGIITLIDFNFDTLRELVGL